MLKLENLVGYAIGIGIVCVYLWIRNPVIESPVIENQSLIDYYKAKSLLRKSEAPGLIPSLSEAPGLIPSLKAPSQIAHSPSRQNIPISSTSFNPHQTKPFLGGSIADKTLRYWRDVTHIVNCVNPEGGVPEMRRITSRLRSLPSAGVDPIAVSAVIELSNALDGCADIKLSDGEQVATYMLETFFRATSGDYGRPVEALEEVRIAQKRFREAFRGLQSTRATLSSKYEIEFPQIL